MATAWTLHGMRDEGSCIVRCVVCVRSVCICVQASPTASSTSTAPALHPGLRDEARTPTDAATPTRPRSLRKKLRPTTHTHTCRPLAGELASPLCPSHVISCSLPSPTVLLASM